MDHTMATLTVLPLLGGEEIVESAKSDHCVKGDGMTLAAVGGFIHGAGIVICGAGPATILVQLGTRTENCLYAFAGCLTGALIYGYLHSKIAGESKQSGILKRKCTVDDYLESGSYARCAIPVFVGVQLFLRNADKYLPADTASGCGCPSIKHGVLLGMINLPILLAMRKMIGCSSSCVTLASQFVPKSFSSNYLESFRSGFKKWWQVLFTTGAIAGAFISARAADCIGTVPGVPKTAAFLGGATMIFGARVANGCVCGHGVTGVSLLSVLSMANTAATIAGGYVTVKAMQSLGVF
ncbi:uncharacterized protein [Ptychodera flava]|uniref:uncharacterized protein isoform X2 n=1 Tax=Ptychodera flava TaxID=63121 RepID=UPI00396A7A09